MYHIHKQRVYKYWGIPLKQEETMGESDLQEKKKQRKAQLKIPVVV